MQNILQISTSYAFWTFMLQNYHKTSLQQKSSCSGTSTSVLWVQIRKNIFSYFSVLSRKRTSQTSVKTAECLSWGAELKDS